MKLVMLILSVVFVTGISSAQTLKGKITDSYGKALPYANIYVEELKTGTISGFNGTYKLELEKEKEFTLVFQHLGHKSHTAKVKLSADEQVMDVSLPMQVIQISEVKVLASGEDPAYYVMRKAIALAPYFAKQVSKYRCKVYLKGTGVIDKVPAILRRRMEKEGLKAHKPFVMESVSKVQFELPDKLDQVVIAQQTSGDDNGTSPMEYVTTSLYQTTNYGIISPFDRGAFRVYKFRLEGVFEDQGRFINRIKVIPRRKGKDLFRGYLNIADKYWNIHSVQLELDQPMTEVKMHQLYAPVDENTWMPVKVGFKIKFAGMGFKVRYNYIASISDYSTTLNPKLDHNFLDNVHQQQKEDAKLLEKDEPTIIIKSRTNKRQQEINKLLAKDELSNRDMRKLQRIMRRETKRNSPPPPLEIKQRVKLSKKATKSDSTYWAQIRPINLSSGEKKSFAEKDSMIKVKNDPAYKDSINNKEKAFKLPPFVFGKTYKFKSKSEQHDHNLKIPGLLNQKGIIYTTVDGYRLRFPFSYNVEDTLGHRFSVAPEVAYSFAREKIDAKARVSYRYNGIRNAAVNIWGGSYTLDFNEYSGMPYLLNSIHSLLAEENFKKLYRMDYIGLSHEMELLNGLDTELGVFWAERSSLENNSHHTFIDYKDRSFTNNNIHWQQNQFSTITGFEVKLKYQHRRQYYLTQYKKTPVGSGYPILLLTYRKTIPNIADSDIDYDFISFSIQDDFYTGHNDKFDYALSAGGFLNKKNVLYPDFKQFNTQYSPVVISAPKHFFRLMPYYKYTSKNFYLNIHTQWETDRLLLKYLPKLNETLINESLFVNFLAVENKEPYWETGYGLRNIFFVMDLEVISSFSGEKYQSTGFKLKFNF